MSLWTVCPARAAEPPAIAVHVLELGDLALDDAEPIFRALERAFHARTNRPVRLEDPTWPCERAARCPSEVSARTGASDVVLLRVFAGPTKLHVIGARVDPRAPDTTAREADVFVRRDADTFDEELAALAGALFPEPAITADLRPSEPIAPDPSARGTPPRRIAGWISLGTGSIAGGVGALFLAAAADRRREIRDDVLPASTHDDLSSRARADDLAGGVLLAVAAGALATGLVLLVLDP